MALVFTRFGAAVAKGLESEQLDDGEGETWEQNKIERMDRCFGTLEKGERPELALRMLKRYTNETFTEAGPWRAWLDKHRARLFFTDVGGYKFLVKPGT